MTQRFSSVRTLFLFSFQALIVHGLAFSVKIFYKALAHLNLNSQLVEARHICFKLFSSLATNHRQIIVAVRQLLCKTVCELIQLVLCILSKLKESMSDRISFRIEFLNLLIHKFCCLKALLSSIFKAFCFFHFDKWLCAPSTHLVWKVGVIAGQSTEQYSSRH